MDQLRGYPFSFVRIQCRYLEIWKLNYSKGCPVNSSQRAIQFFSYYSISIVLIICPLLSGECWSHIEDVRQADRKLGAWCGQIFPNMIQLLRQRCSWSEFGHGRARFCHCLDFGERRSVCSGTNIVHPVWWVWAARHHFCSIKFSNYKKVCTIQSRYT